MTTYFYTFNSSGDILRKYDDKYYCIANGYKVRPNIVVKQIDNDIHNIIIDDFVRYKLNMFEAVYGNTLSVSFNGRAGKNKFICHPKIRINNVNIHIGYDYVDMINNLNNMSKTIELFEYTTIIDHICDFVPKHLQEIMIGTYANYCKMFKPSVYLRNKIKDLAYRSDCDVQSCKEFYEYMKEL